MSRSEDRLLDLAVSFCGEAATAQIVAPLVADMAHELENTTGLRRIALQLRWEAAFFTTVLRLGVPYWATRDEGAGVRTALIAFSTSAVATALLIGIVLLNLSWRSAAAGSFRAADWISAATYLLPQAVIGLPIGLVAAALFNSRRHRPAARQSLGVLIGLACCATLVLLWILPDSNQAFRVLLNTGSHPPVPGPRELGLFELSRKMLPGGIGPFASSSQVALAFHSRVAVLVSPLAFGALALALSRPFTKTTTIVLSATLIGGYLGFFVWPAPLAMGESGIMPPVIAPWVPNLFALAVAGALRAGSVNRPAAGTVA